MKPPRAGACPLLTGEVIPSNLTRRHIYTSQLGESKNQPRMRTDETGYEWWEVKLMETHPLADFMAVCGISPRLR